MSCGGGCSGGGESPRIPSYIPSDRRQRQRPARRRLPRPPIQNEQTGIGPAAPYWRPGPMGSPPGSPRSPLAASSPAHELSPLRYPPAARPCPGANRPVSPNRRPIATPPGSPRSPLAASSPVYQISPVRPRGGVPCPVGSPRSPLNRTYDAPGVPDPPRRAVPLNTTFGRGAPVLDRTYNMPGRYPPVPLPPQRDLNRTYDVPRDRTYDIPDGYPPVPIINQLADNIMDDMGDGDEWDVSTSVSVDDIEDDEDGLGLDDISPPDFPDDPTEYLDDISPPEFPEATPEYLDDITPPQFPEDTSQYLDDISPPQFPEDSQGYLDDISPPDFVDLDDDAPCAAPCAEGGDAQNDSSGGDSMISRIYEMAEAPSNISVYDAEVLNRTTAPRSSNIDIPRCRIWQSLMDTINDHENQEDQEYEEFVNGIQQQRRDFMESSP